MRRTAISTLAAVLMLVMLGVPILSHAKALYDNFSEQHLDGRRWLDLDLVREVSGGRLVSRIASVTGYARNQTRFQNPEAITSIRADMAVTSSWVKSGTDTEVLAKVEGIFYNDTASGGATGDISGQVNIFDEGHGLSAHWHVIRVLNDSATDFEEVQTGQFPGAGSLSYDTFYTASVAYDETTNQFTFTFNGQSVTASGPSRQRGPALLFKSLTTGVKWQTDDVGEGRIQALFDNVYVNGSAYDDFSTSPLNRAKWAVDEIVRETADGKLRLNVQGYDQKSTNTIHLTHSNASYLEATVTVKPGSFATPPDSGFARLDGYYYNDSRGPGSGLDHNQYEGNIFVQNRILIDPNGTLRAIARVDRSNDAAYTSNTELFVNIFSSSIDYGEDVVLSITFQGNLITFTCNEESASYPITTPIYPPYDEVRSLQTRIYSGVGYVNAVFDNVYVEDGGATSFSDVPVDHWAYDYVENLYEAGITQGCAPGLYCPNDSVNRAQMAVFLERGLNGGSFTPDPAMGIFADVAPNYWAADWIEEFYGDGITTGCSSAPLSYCPESPVTRAEMAVFLLRTLNGSGYAPPGATGIFNDVPVGYWADDWVEDLYAEGITTGCDSAPLKYCPDQSVTRAEMAVFLSRTFDL